LTAKHAFEFYILLAGKIYSTLAVI